METKIWKVYGDDILKRYQVVRKARHGGLSAIEYVQTGDRVRIFHDKEKAQKVADQYNKSEERVSNGN